MTMPEYQKMTKAVARISLATILQKLNHSSQITITAEHLRPLLNPIGHYGSPVELIPGLLWGYSALERSGTVYCVWLKIKSPQHAFTIDVYARLFTSENTRFTILKQALLNINLLVDNPQLCNVKNSLNTKWSYVIPL